MLPFPLDSLKGAYAAVIEARLGQWVGGVMRLGTVSWRFDRRIDLAR